jgi:hypothetical protein
MLSTIDQPAQTAGPGTPGQNTHARKRVNQMAVGLALAAMAVRPVLAGVDFVEKPCAWV